MVVLSKQFEHFELCRQIRYEYNALKQSPEKTEAKESIRSKLENLLIARMNRNLRPIQVVMMGSSWNKELALDDSDLDLGVYIKDGHSYQDSLPMLEVVKNIICQMNAVLGGQIVGTKPAVFRFTYGYGDDLAMKVDLQMYKESMSLSKMLIEHYIKIDDRFPKLAVILKKWAKVKNINDASLGKLSSYAITSLVIQYLQDGCKPRVLPVLHKDYPNLFRKPKVETFGKHRFDRFTSSNQDCLGKLLIEFFDYYAKKRDFRKECISIKTGQPTMRTDNYEPFILVKEPFDNNNLTKAIKEEDDYNDIIKAFKEAQRDMNCCRDLEALVH